MGYIWPIVGRRPLELDRIDALAGRYSLDASTPLTADTWGAAYWSAQSVLSALDAIAGGDRARVRAVPPAGPSCRPRLSRRLLPPQHRGDRRAGGDRRRREARRDPRRGLSPRQRHAGHLLGARRRVLRLDPRRSGDRLSVLLGPCRRGGRGRRRRRDAQPAAAARHRARRLPRRAGQALAAIAAVRARPARSSVSAPTPISTIRSRASRSAPRIMP